MAWRGIALHDIRVRVYQYCRGVPAAFVAWAYISPWGAFQGRLPAVLAVSLHIRLAPAHVLMAWLTVSVVAFVCFLVFPLPPLPI